MKWGESRNVTGNDAVENKSDLEVSKLVVVLYAAIKYSAQKN